MKTVLFYSVIFVIIGILSCHNHLNENLTLDVSELNGLDTLVDKNDNNGFSSDFSPPSNFPLIQIWRTLFGFLNNRNNRVYRFFMWRKVNENSSPILIKQTIYTNNYLKKSLRDMGINFTQDNENNTTVFEDHSTNIHNVSAKTDVQQNASQNVTRKSKTILINQTLYPKNWFRHMLNHFKGTDIESTQDSKSTTTIFNNYLTKVHNVSIETGIHQKPNGNISRDVKHNLSQIETKQYGYPQKNFKRHSRGIEINSTQDNINNTTILKKYSNDNYNVSVKTDIHKKSSLIKNVDNNSSSFQIKQTVYPKNISERIFKGKEINLTQDNENSTTIMNKYSTNTYNVSVKTDIKQNTSLTPNVESQTLMNSKIHVAKMLKSNSDQSHTFQTPITLNYYQQNKADADKISGEIPSPLLSDQVTIINTNSFLTIIAVLAGIVLITGVVFFVAKNYQGELSTFFSRRTENNLETPV